MRGTQHLHFGVVTGAAAASCMAFSGLVNPLSVVPFVVLSGLGSLVPDIDSPESKLGRRFPFLSTFIEKKFGHRTITHAVLPWLIVAVLSVVFLPFWSWGFVYGILSHLFLDALTIHGVPFVVKKKKGTNIHLLPKFLRCKSGGFVSVLYTFLAGMSSVLLFGMISFLAIGAQM